MQVSTFLIKIEEEPFVWKGMVYWVSVDITDVYCYCGESLTSGDSRWYILIAGADFRDLHECKHLQELHLKGCYKLTNLSVAALRNLTALTLLNLHECWQITAAGVASLSSICACLF